MTDRQHCRHVLHPQFIEAVQMTSQTSFATQAGQFLRQKGKLELLTGLIGAKALQNHRRMQEANQEAENRAVRQAAWGSDERVDLEGDDVGNTILGDVTQPAPVIVGAAASSNPAAWILAAGLAAAAGFFGRDLIDDKKPDVVVPGSDETVQIRLGRIEDYLGEQQ